MDRHCLVERAKHLLGKLRACEWGYMLLPLGFARLEHKDSDCYPISSSHTLLPIALGGLVTMESTICSLPPQNVIILAGLGTGGSRGVRALWNYLQWIGLMGGSVWLAEKQMKGVLCFHHLWLLTKRNKSGFSKVSNHGAVYSVCTTFGAGHSVHVVQAQGAISSSGRNLQQHHTLLLYWF